MAYPIGSTLAKLRKAKNLKQKDVASSLSGYGIIISAKTIHNWERGLVTPNAQQFLALCDLFGVDDVLWQFAGIQRGAYAGLNQHGRRKAREFIDLLFHIEKYRDNPEDFSELPRLLRLFDIPVSAGSGNFLEESGFEMVAVPAHVPVSADFALRVSGDSMEPMLQDGQIIWIKEQELLNSGDIGIFIYENDVYCKELVIDSDRLYLRSLNPGYEDVEVNESLGFKVIGKLVA